MRNVLLCLTVACPVSSSTADQPIGKDQRGNDQRGFVIGNREQPTQTQLAVISKSFCVAMRRLGADGGPGTLRQFIDPQYLADHDLETGPLEMETAPVGSLYTIEVAADGRTVLCIVETDDHEKEAILLRIVLRDGAIYFSPPRPPMPESESFAPWLLRTPV